MTRFRALALAWGALTLSLPALADGMPGKDPSESQILSDIHHVNQHEIGLGRLAEGRSGNDSVLGIARRMIDDHKKADQQTMDLAKREKIKISDISMSEEEGALQGKLGALQGAKFDRAYLKAMEDGHKKVIARLTEEEKGLENPDVRSFVNELLPKLQHHQEMAALVLKKEKSTG
jgi:putative membrane protein